MKLLIVGGAGYVGSILRPALEARHDCYYLDLKPIPGVNGRGIIGDVNNDDAVKDALQGKDALVWLAMGVKAGMKAGNLDLDASFDVNVRGFYRVLAHAVQAGMRRFIYASSLSVYERLPDRTTFPLGEDTTPDAWYPYGLTKRLGEVIGETLVRKFPDATFVGLRLMWPRSEQDWPGNEFKPGETWYPIGPQDLRRLFLAAIECDKRGAHHLNGTGDLEGLAYPFERAREVLGWMPEGK